MSATSGNQLSPNNVISRDPDTEIVDLYMTEEIESITLTSALSVDDAVASLDSPSATPIAGNMLEIKDPGGTAFYQGQILVVAPTGGDGYDLSLDTPLDFPFGMGANISLGSRELNVDGSVTPKTFIVSPAGLLPGTRWDVTRIVFHIQGDQTMDDGKFGDLAALTKGVIVRAGNGFSKNIMNAKTNGEFIERAFDREYADFPPATKSAVVIRRTFGGSDKNGVVLRISTDDGDGVRCIVQDNLTALDLFRIVVQGHVTDEFEQSL